ncbi:MAG: zinc ABC transporter substrate-binding protein [Clostridia bacterium]|nr:zinc ABC transporter substrate-binding protein [Clostridia bacterium]
MKKTVLLILCVLFIVSALCGCSSNDVKRDKLSVVATIFPEYDWVRNIIGNDSETISLSMLLDNGTDLHSYQPTANDIVRISTCDMFIYVGGESDNWVKVALKEASNKDMTVISLLDILGENAMEEETPKGAETSHEENDAEEKEYAEHVWLSLKNAAVFCGHIAEGLGAIDSKNKDKYLQNAKEYIDRINALDKKYRQAIDDSKNRTLVFGDRFPFVYLAEDYGLECYAAFSGCSAETEASFKTVISLAEKINELSLGAVLKIETSDGSVANSIKNATRTKDQTVLTLDSMQSINAKNAQDKDHLSVMEDNLKIIQTALKK